MQSMSCYARHAFIINVCYYYCNVKTKQARNKAIIWHLINEGKAEHEEPKIKRTCLTLGSKEWRKVAGDAMYWPRGEEVIPAIILNSFSPTNSPAPNLPSIPPILSFSAVALMVCPCLLCIPIQTLVVLLIVKGRVVSEILMLMTLRLRLWVCFGIYDG